MRMKSCDNNKPYSPRLNKAFFFLPWLKRKKQVFGLA